LLLSLLKYLAPSRPFVVYSPYIEPLMETYLAVKDTGKAVMVMLTETWLRNYQARPVLPDGIF
jgi:tRNA (adenine-N(1)-)-methyltransferase non-catalytic subunit